jgi:ketosteroid isomerase-like protein
MTALHDTAKARPLEAVLSAYAALGQGDPAPVVELLEPDVEWWSQGVRLYRGRDAAARVFERAGRGIEITGIRKGATVVVLEFSRPWWKRRRAADALVSASLGLRADQAVWLRDGRIRKLETRDRVAPRPAAA